MGKFAEGTHSTVDASMGELRALLRRYKAGAIAMYDDEKTIRLAFKMQERQVRFDVPLPDRSQQFKVAVNQFKSEMKPLTDSQYEQECRRRWRALVLVVKAKLESVESGIETFDEAFTSQLLLPSGQTVGQWLTPQIQKVYASNAMPPMLPGGS